MSDCSKECCDKAAAKCCEPTADCPNPTEGCCEACPEKAAE